MPSPYKIFIAYSHQERDKAIKDHLWRLLRPLELQKAIEVWDDGKIQEGEEWKQKILDQISTCDIALILVSEASLASDFIMETELPCLRARKDDGQIDLIPVLLEDCPFLSVSYLKGLQFYPSDRIFVGTGGEEQRKKHLLGLVERINQRIKAKSETASAPSVSARRPPAASVPAFAHTPTVRHRLQRSPWQIVAASIVLVLIVCGIFAIFWFCPGFWFCPVDAEPVAVIRLDGRPVAEARVTLLDAKRGNPSVLLGPHDQGRVVFAGLKRAEVFDPLRIEVLAPKRYLPIAHRRRGTEGKAEVIDLRQEALVPEAPMVEIPSGTLVTGIEDPSFTAQLMRELQAAGIENMDDIFGQIGAPPRRATLRAFDIDFREVTNAEYRRFLSAAATDRRYAHRREPANHDRTPATWQQPSPYSLREDDQPVTGVDFFDAYAYCRWAGKRLPREDEWEAAARGNDARRYPWGNEFDAERFSDENGTGLGPRAVVGLDPSRPGGPAAMAGNVSEWTTTDQPAEGAVIKGGSWTNLRFPSVFALSARQLRASATDRTIDVGFRCARDAEGTAAAGMVRIGPAEYALGGENGPLLDLARRTRISIKSFLKQPPGSRTVSAFHIDRQEVSNASYRQFLAYLEEISGGAASTSAQYHGNKHAPQFWADPNLAGARQPVVGVDWHDADGYCRWLGKALPTPDHWLRAARGDSSRLYPWGNTFEKSRGVFAETRPAAPAAVDDDPQGASSFGVLHMGGNVEEWLAGGDSGPGAEKQRPLRGGNWRESGEIKALLVIAPILAVSTYRGNEVGFRCADGSEK